MNLLITGCSGFIGSHFCKTLIKHNKFKLFALIRELTVKENIPEGVEIIRFDNIQNLINIITQKKIDGIIHLATYFISNHSSDDIDHLVNSNILFGLYLLEAISKIPTIKWFINTSSYWQHYNKSLYSPVSLYAATKQAFQDIIIFYKETTSIKFVNLELFDSYGPYDKRKKLFNILKNQIHSSTVLKMSPGEQKLNLVYINDIIFAFQILINLLISNKNLLDTYCISSSKLSTLKEIVDIFSEVYDVNLNIEWGGIPYRNREIMSPELIYPIVPGWIQKYDLRSGLIEMKKKEEIN